jgi:uroporphyrinogen decarboxylase
MKSSDEDSLSGKERVLRAMSFQEVDRVPVIPVTHTCSAKLVGLTLSEAMADPKKFVESQVKCLEQFGYDGVWGLVATEVAEALGSEIEVQEDDIPGVGDGVLTDSTDISKLPAPDFENSVWMNRKLEVLELLRQEVGDREIIIAPAIAPLRAAATLRGMTNFMLDMIEEPDFVKELMDVCTEHCHTAALMLANSGADMLFYPIPLASKNLISRDTFEEFVYPYLKRFLGGLREEGIQTLVHPCGDWDDRYDLLGDLGADMLQITSLVDMGSVRDDFGDQVTLLGQVDCLNTLFDGSPEEVKAESIANIKAAGEGGGFILSSDCSLPRDTPPANIHAMVDAVRELAH